MDFVSFNKDKHEYDNVLVIMDRLSKEFVSIPCNKTTTAEEMASLFIYHVWRYFRLLIQLCPIEDHNSSQTSRPSSVDSLALS
jgi:hypothetical protein